MVIDNNSLRRRPVNSHRLTGPANGAGRTPAASDHSTASRVLGVEALCTSLERLKIDVLFGTHSPSSQVVSALYSSDRRWTYVQVDHEADVGNVALGYARTSGRSGLCVIESTFRATSLTNALYSAQRDSIPLVVLAIRSSDRAERSNDDGVDIVGMTMPITKHNFVVSDETDIPSVLFHAFHIASTGRPGSVLIELPGHLLMRQTTFSWPEEVRLRGYRPTVAPHRKQVLLAAQRIGRALSPVVWVGGGAVSANAAAELLEFVELTGIPVVSTERARGLLPDSHHLNYRTPGTAGNAGANAALRNSDVIVALGVWFDRSVGGELAVLAPNAELVQVDIDPEEVGGHRTAEVSIVGDCKFTLAALCLAVRQQNATDASAALTQWHAYLKSTASATPFSDAGRPADLQLEALLRGVSRRAEAGAIFVCGEGPHRRLAADLRRFEKPRQWLGVGAEQGVGTSVATAIGAQIAAPYAQVWVLESVSSFHSFLHALVVAVTLGLPLKILLFEVECGRNGVEISALESTILQSNPLSVARSLGCVVIDGGDNSLLATLNSALAVRDRPAVVYLPRSAAENSGSEH